MDIGGSGYYQGGSKSYGSNFSTGGGLMYKFKRFNSKLTPRGRWTFIIIFLIIFYKFILGGSLTFGLFGRNGINSQSAEDIEDEVERISLNEEVNKLIHEGNEKISRNNLNYLKLDEPFVNQNDLSVYNYDNGGNMFINQHDKKISLVTDDPHKIGYIFSNNAMTSKDAESFEIEIDFSIHGEQLKTGLIGDGLAIWLTDKHLQRGDVFGMQSNYNGLGIFIDTYRNGQRIKGQHKNFPYVSIQPNNGQYGKYDKNTDGAASEIGGCSLHRVYNMRSGDGLSRLRIYYIKKTNYLSIDFDVSGTGKEFQNCFTSENNNFINLPSNPFLGLSAETGDLYHQVDIFKIKATSLKDATTGESIESIDKIIDLVESDRSSSSSGIENDGSNSNFANTDNSHEAISERRRRRINRRNQKIEGRKSKSHQKKVNKRLKEMNENSFGDERGPIGWILNKLWVLLKISFYLSLLSVFTYIAYVGLRVYKDNKRKNNTRGLL
ncbi:hypothetical protein B5S31_g259 [[Candida] boidinii]|nr:hypothetical protein B5S31_g259 [[Candida] boidinii]OWB78127.1 hypothetical protein B5S32_g2313 [[Candida] boidinii]